MRCSFTYPAPDDRGDPKLNSAEVIEVVAEPILKPGVPEHSRSGIERGVRSPSGARLDQRHGPDTANIEPSRSRSTDDLSRSSNDVRIDA